MGKDLSATKRKYVILMDEIDGMATDPGGPSELLKIINKSKIPIICIANDRSHYKLRILAKHSYNIKYELPSAQNIASHLSSILIAENINIKQECLISLVEKSNHDIR